MTEKWTIIASIMTCGKTKWLYIHSNDRCILMNFSRDYVSLPSRKSRFYVCLRIISRK